MKTFRIKETGKIETLEMIDPKSGCCWLGDAVSDDNTIKPFGCDDDYDGDEADFDCNQESFDWWAEYAPKYQAADERWYELKKTATGDTVDYMENDLLYLGAEFNEYAYALDALCDRWEKLIADIDSGMYFTGSEKIAAECEYGTREQWKQHVVDSGWYSDYLHNCRSENYDDDCIMTGDEWADDLLENNLTAWDGDPCYTKIQ